MTKETLDKIQISNLLPHREPMLLIDELYDIQKLFSATAVVNVKKDSFFVQKVNYLQGMLLSKKGGENIDSLLNIHLSIISDPEFNPSYSIFKNSLNKK